MYFLHFSRQVNTGFLTRSKTNEQVSFWSRAFDGTGATLVDIDRALLECGMLITLVDHDSFKAIPLAERAGKIVYDVRGIWPDQPKNAVQRQLWLAS